VNEPDPLVLNEASGLIAVLKRRGTLPDPATARTIREEARASQAELAAVLGVTRPTVSRWEAGSRRPRGRDLDAYIELLAALDEEVFP
jgi:DNA-binding transcriptional regulator YiaG